MGILKTILIIIGTFFVLGFLLNIIHIVAGWGPIGLVILAIVLFVIISRQN